jgi:hypothetical protein
VRYHNSMNVTDEPTNDPTLRRVELTKKTLEVFVTVLVLAIYIDMFVSDDVTYKVKRYLKKLRHEWFGPPKLTEEQLKHQESQVIIEALKVLRQEQK